MKFTIFATITITTLLPGALSAIVGQKCGGVFVYPCLDQGYAGCVSEDGSSSTCHCVHQTTDSICNNACLHATFPPGTDLVYAYMTE
jgi:hypothetical protein